MDFVLLNLSTTITTAFFVTTKMFFFSPFFNWRNHYATTLSPSSFYSPPPLIELSVMFISEFLRKNPELITRISMFQIQQQH